MTDLNDIILPLKTNDQVNRDAAIAELILSSSKPVLDTLDSVMFEMVSKLPKDTNFEMWDEISDVFIRYRKSR